MKSTYFAKNQPLWLKFSFDSCKIKDWFCSVGIQQKQLSRGVHRKGCSENMQQISTSNHMFKRKIWDKFTEFTFLKFWNLLSETREISKFQKMNKVNFPQIPRINMWFLINHMWQALNAVKEHTRVRIMRKTINIDKFNKHNSIT